MDTTEIKHFIEAAMLAAGRPLSVDQLQKLFDGRGVPDKSDIRQAIATLAEDYEPRGITIGEVASGFRIQIKASMADQLHRLWEEKPPRYSRALFETLALVAYRQPITRGEIEEVRGVSVSPNIVRTLQERDWIRVVGHRDVPGRPEMFGTTRQFLDYFGLKKLDDLPPLADLSDWESMRVQLNLPEVEQDTSGDEESAPGVAELPSDADEGTAATTAGEPEQPIDEKPEIGVGDEATAEVDDQTSTDDTLPPIEPEEEELVVSEWPDPAKSGG